MRAALRSDTDRPATLRLGLDNWALVFLNGRQVATLDHAEQFEVAELPVQLKQGHNSLVIKTNNRQNRDRLIWVINCVVQ